MAFGITPAGLKIKRLADIKEELESDARAVFGGSVDLDPRRPLGQLIGIQSERLAQIWELIESVYNSSSPRYATGKQLDEIALYNGLTRRPATRSKVSVVVYGELGTIVPSGARASVLGSPESLFSIDEDVTILAGTNEVQKLVFLSRPIDGSFTLVVDGVATTSIPYNADAAAIKSALEQTSAPDTVIVSGSIQTEVTIEFTGGLGQRPVPLLTVGSNTLTSRTIHVITCAADSNGTLMSTAFRFDDPVGSVGVYIDIDDTGAPVPPGLDAVTDRSIRISTIEMNDSAATVATMIAAALNTDPEILEAVVINTNQVRITMLDELPLQGLVNLDTPFTFTTTNIGRDVGGLSIARTRVTPGVLPNGTGSATAVDTGPIPAPSGSLTVLEDQIEGWVGINNPLDAEQGDSLETDAQFKARRVQQFGKAGRATPSAIRAKLLEVEGVDSATVQVNSGDTTANGIPPHSIRVFVRGGEDSDIAASLYDNVAAGIATAGSVVVNHVDQDGEIQIIRFSRPTEVPIYVTLEVEVAAGTWPSNGEALLKEAVLAYGETLRMGDDVIPYPYMMSHLNILPGIIKNLVLTIDLEPDPHDDIKIDIPNEEIAVFDTSRINVTVDVVS